MVKSPSYFVLEVNFYHQGQKKMVLDTLQIIKIICQCYINTGNIFISIKVLSLRSMNPLHAFYVLIFLCCFASKKKKRKYYNMGFRPLKYS